MWYTPIVQLIKMLRQKKKKIHSQPGQHKQYREIQRGGGVLAYRLAPPFTWLFRKINNLSSFNAYTFSTTLNSVRLQREVEMVYFFSIKVWSICQSNPSNLDLVRNRISCHSQEHWLRIHITGKTTTTTTKGTLQNWFGPWVYLEKSATSLSLFF